MDSPPHILIIDDDEFDRLNIRRALVKAAVKAEFHYAIDGESAWKALNERIYDCIFLDYLLPRTDGIQLLKAIRAAGIPSPIIVVTSQGDEKVAVDVMKSGGTDYIAKGQINQDTIAQIFRTALRNAKAEIEKKRAEDALRISEMRLVEAQRLAKIGSWEVRLEDLKIFWTPEVYRIFGYEPESVEPSFDIYIKHLIPEDRQRSRKAIERCLNNHEEVRVDMQIVCADGISKYVELQGKPETNEKGEVIMLSGTVQDITDRKKIEQQLIEARDLAERSARARQEFVANVSHEIRTPMNAILGYAELLSRTPMDPSQNEYLESIQYSGEILLGVINDILDISKIEAGKLVIDPIDFDLTKLVSSLINIFRPQADPKKITLSHSISPEVPKRLHGDFMRLNQVLINLFSNALKFTNQGSVSLSIDLPDPEKSPYLLHFSVKDSGIGIPGNKLESIFETFTQAETETTRKYGGTGLGLAISKGIVTLMGGTIHAKSTLGKGSEFYFDLPFQPAKTEAILTDSPHPSTGREVQHLRILLAEDNRLNQKLAVQILQDFGYEVEIAGNGVQAVEKMKTGGFDLILMDMQMPEMDGLQATRIIRAIPDARLNSIPIIALTAHAIAEERDKCKEAGMNDFLSKPFNPAELQAIILANLPKGSATEHSQPALPPKNQPDLSQLDALTNGNESFRTELIQIFIEDSQVESEQLIQAAEPHDPEKIRKILHRLKPAMELFGIPDKENLVDAVKSAPDQETALPAINQLVDRLTETATFLRAQIG